MQTIVAVKKHRENPMLNWLSLSLTLSEIGLARVGQVLFSSITDERSFTITMRKGTWMNLTLRQLHKVHVMFQQWLQVTTNKRLMTSVQFSPSATARNGCFKQTHDRLSTILNLASWLYSTFIVFVPTDCFWNQSQCQVWHVCITSSWRASHIWDSGIYELSHLNS